MSETEEYDDKAKKPKRRGPQVTASEVRKRWEDGSAELMLDRRTYWVNLSFFVGEQWIKWDRQRQTVVEQLPANDRVRLTVNRIRPNLNALLGRLTGKPLAFEIRPTDSDDSTVSGAKLAESVLTSCHDDLEWENVRSRAILDAFLGGTSMVAFDWDPTAGETLQVDAQTQQIVGTGEVRLTPLSVTEFCLEAGVRDPYRSRYWTQGIQMSCQDAKDRYRLEKLPPSDGMVGMSALQSRLLMETGRKNIGDTCLVLTSWEPPRHDYAGHVATVIGSEVVDGPHPWPFPSETLNFALFRQSEVTHRWPGDTILNDAIPLQVAYNATYSAIVEQVKLAGNPRLLVDQSSFEMIDELTDEPGEVLQWSGIGSPPTYLVPPAPGRSHQFALDSLQARIDDAMHVHDVSRGAIDINRTAAASISLLSEKDDTPLGVFAHGQAAGWARLGRMILECYEDKVTETRTATIDSSGPAPVTRTMKWNGAQLKGQCRVRVPLDATRPFSRVAAEQFAVQAWNMKITADPKVFAKLAHLDQSEILEILDPDATKAMRENALMECGEVALPADFDNHGIHIAEHNAFRKTPAYEYASPEVRQVVDLHIQGHATLAAEEAAQQAMKATQLPGSETLPQGREPIGSMVPMPARMQQQMQQPAQQGAMN